MFLKRIVSEGLAHFSYLVRSGTKAFVVDPRPHHEWAELHLEDVKHVFVGIWISI